VKYRYRVAEASRDELTSDGMIDDPDGPYVRWDVANAEYLALERVAVALRDALKKSLTAIDAFWPNDRPENDGQASEDRAIAEVRKTSRAALSQAATLESGKMGSSGADDAG
jgi:hypothetical protein